MYVKTINLTQKSCKSNDNESPRFNLMKEIRLKSHSKKICNKLVENILFKNVFQNPVEIKIQKKIQLKKYL